MRRFAPLTLTLLVLLALSACSTTPSYDKADASLQATNETGNFGAVLLRHGEPLPTFTRVYVEEVPVELSRQWLSSHRSNYSRSDVERIERDYGERLRTALRNGLTDQTEVEVVDSADEADVVLRPHLRKLNIYAPDLMQPATRYYYSDQMGNATLDLYLVHPRNGNVLAQFVDHREVRAGIIFRGERATRGTNLRYFGRTMDRWAFDFVDYLMLTGTIEHTD
ncbi:hypothetical protein [Marinimicrobium alkaliphilum]|uniref:hypothetical protein n=1 Tax=Marinimicrobium alkaliphilum TaxID=2202654 RepID=UPI000DB9AC31|nr:hypothetical protein [Marinimicrobium alkaliphilum]